MFGINNVIIVTDLIEKEFEDFLDIDITQNGLTPDGGANPSK
jgi:hypothetical protein